MVDRTSVHDVLGQFLTYRQKPTNGAWGALHVVMDDGNVADSHVRGCIEYARERGDADGEALARILLQMSRTQRLKIRALVGGVIYGR